MATTMTSIVLALATLSWSKEGPLAGYTTPGRGQKEYEGLRYPVPGVHSNHLSSPLQLQIIYFVQKIQFSLFPGVKTFEKEQLLENQVRNGNRKDISSVQTWESEVILSVLRKIIGSNDIWNRNMFIFQHIFSHHFKYIFPLFNRMYAFP